MINSSSTEESSFARSTEIKEFADLGENEDREDGFQEIGSKKKAGNFSHSIRKLPITFRHQCFVRNIFEKFGSLFIFDRNNSKLFISKMRIVNFPMNKHIFEKGKEKENQMQNSNGKINFDKIDKSTIPEIKFWNQRYYYYSKFDEGIKMDYESWYSVTPEELAKYISLAVTKKTSVVVDAFCGSGGNVIQFSKYCKYVYAVDIDPNKIEICKNNCKVYNCEKNIDFVLSDFLKMENKIKADYIFLSPPWGGVEYKDSEFYSIKNMMTPDIYQIIRVCLSIGKKIIFYFPRTIMLTEFYEILDDILQEKNEQDYIYTDIHILNSANKIKAVMLVFGLNIDDDVSSLDLKKYLKFYYKTLMIDEESLTKLINISKVIGKAKFFRAEYAFRTNQEKNIRLCPIKNLINFFKNELFTENELCKFKILQEQSKLEQVKKVQTSSSDRNNSYYRNSLPWKNKTYFVEGKIMSEDEFHKYRDNLLIN